MAAEHVPADEIIYEITYEITDELAPDGSGEQPAPDEAVAAPEPPSGERIAEAPPAPRRIVRYVLLGAFGFDTLLYTLVVPFLPGHAQALGASPAVTGALFASYAAGLLLATPPAGWLTDHIGARTTLLGGLGALAASTLIFAFAPGLPMLFAARAAQGISAAVTWTAGLVLIAQLYRPNELPRIFGAIFGVTAVGMLIGPTLGGELYTLGGFPAPFVVAIVFVLLDGIGRLVFIPGRAAVDISAPVTGVVRRLVASGNFWLGLIATFGGAAVLSSLDPTLAPLLGARFGLGAAAVGLCFGALVLAFTFAQWPVAVLTRWWRARRLIVGGLLISAGAFALIGTSEGFVLTFAALLLLAIALAGVMAPSLELLTQAGQEEVARTGGLAYGAIYALYNLAYAGGMLVGPIASGSAVAWAGTTQGFLFVGVVPFLFAVLCLAPRPRQQSLRT